MCFYQDSPQKSPRKSFQINFPASVSHPRKYKLSYNSYFELSFCLRINYMYIGIPYTTCIYNGSLVHLYFLYGTCYLL